MGSLVLSIFPDSGISISMAALIGMSSMFAGASRAYLTSITFALEATMQSHALLPLLGACTASYLVSFFLMENTIMTEKIARRGIYTPDSYEPDILSSTSISKVLKKDLLALSEENTIQELKTFFAANPPSENNFLVVDDSGSYRGSISLASIYNENQYPDSLVSSLMNTELPFVSSDDKLAKAVSLMADKGVEYLPVLSSNEENVVIGLLTYKDILTAYKLQLRESVERGTNLSLSRQRRKILLRGRRIMNMNKIRIDKNP